MNSFNNNINNMQNVDFFTFKVSKDTYRVSLNNYNLDWNSFEPAIDKKTLRFHYEVLFNKYANMLNTAFESELFKDLSDFKGCRNLSDILSRLKSFYEGILEENVDMSLRRSYINLYWNLKNAGGGVLNHNLFFKVLTPNSRYWKISSKFMSILMESFASVDVLKKYLVDYSINTIGDGWRFLTVKKIKGEYKISIQFTRIHDSPFLYGNYPILALDLWEHSYIGNTIFNGISKADYVNAFYKSINWGVVENEYNKAIDSLS